MNPFIKNSNLIGPTSVILIISLIGCMTTHPGEIIRQDTIQDTERYVGSEYEIRILQYPSPTTKPVLQIEVKQIAHWEVKVKNIHKVDVEESFLTKAYIYTVTLGGLFTSIALTDPGNDDKSFLDRLGGGALGLGLMVLLWLPTLAIRKQEQKKVANEVIEGGDQENKIITRDGFFSNGRVKVIAGERGVTLQTDRNGILQVDLLNDLNISSVINPESIEIGFETDDQLSPISPIRVDGRYWLTEHIMIDFFTVPIYRSADFNSQVITDAKRGDIFRVISKRDDWARVGTEYGPGWIFVDDVTLFWSVSDHLDFPEIPERIVTGPAPEREISEAPISIEKNIPIAPHINRDAVAVIIGNRNYRRDVPNVDFAFRDASLTRRYVEQAFGYRSGNVIYLEDATLSETRSIFGDDRSPRGRLSDLVKKGVSDVFVYYSGHGSPDPRTRAGYLIPVDGDPNRLSLTSYSLYVLYENLGKLEARSVTVVIDACFSGYTGAGDMLIEWASPIGIEIMDPAARITNGIIITASVGLQIASWHPEKRYGLLTYLFLKGIQGEADLNQDGRITVGELRSYLNDELPYYARRLHGREQTPQVWGEEERILR